MKTLDDLENFVRANGGDFSELFVELRGGWQPIETAPKDGTYIELYRPRHPDDMIASQILYACWIGQGWCWPSGIYNPLEAPDYEECFDGYMDVSFTHWRPLPTPPQEGE